MPARGRTEECRTRSTPGRLHVGCLRGACRAQQRDLRRVLVHRLPPGVRPEGDQLSRGQGGPGPHRSRPRRPRPRRGRRRTGMVPVRQPRGTPGHQAPARVRQGRAAASGLADHLLLRRQETSRPGHRTGGAGRRSRPDRPGRRRPRRGHLRGDHRPRGAGPFPVQRDRRTLRAVRIHPQPAGWQARMDREQGGRSGVTVRCSGMPPLPRLGGPAGISVVIQDLNGVLFRECVSGQGLVVGSSLNLLAGIGHDEDLVVDLGVAQVDKVNGFEDFPAGDRSNPPRCSKSVG